MPFGVEYERKVHFFHDQKGARINSHIPGVEGKLFANTACKMNSDVPETHITTDLGKVTCKLCLSKKQPASRFNNVRNFGSIPNYIEKSFSEVADEVFAARKIAKRAHQDEFEQWCLNRERMKLADGRRIRYRRSWRGKLILQVEDIVYHIHPQTMEESVRYRWRDALLTDLSLGVV